jgi:hypothetical protein
VAVVLDEAEEDLSAKARGEGLQARCPLSVLVLCGSLTHVSQEKRSAHTAMESIIMAATEMAMHKDTRASQTRASLTKRHRRPSLTRVPPQCWAP